MAKIEKWLESIAAELQHKGYKAGPVVYRDIIDTGLAVAFTNAARFEGKTHCIVHKSLQGCVIGVQRENDAVRIRDAVNTLREQMKFQALRA